MEKIKALEQEFWSARDQFLWQYGALRESASEEWRRMAQNLVPDPERLVAAIESSFPFTQKMDRFYGFDVQVFQISLPESLETDLITLDDQMEVVAARQRAAQEAGTKIRRNVEEFAAECVASLREQTAQLCQDMLASIHNSETGVHQKTLNRLVRFIDQFKQMNFMNDTQMEQQLDQVRRELLSKTADEYRDSKTARARLVNGLQSLSTAAQELSKQDASELVQRFGQVGRRKFHLAA